MPPKKKTIIKINVAVHGTSRYFRHYSESYEIELRRRARDRSGANPEPLIWYIFIFS
jgi:hypothetical protein